MRDGVVGPSWVPWFWLGAVTLGSYTYFHFQSGSRTFLKVEVKVEVRAPNPHPDVPGSCAHQASKKMSGIQSGGVRAATQQVEDALLQEYDQIAGGVSKYALLAQKYGLDSESSLKHKMRRARARRQSAEATSTVSVHEAMARLAVIQL